MLERSLFPTSLSTIQSSNNCLVFYKDGVKLGDQPYAATARFLAKNLNITDANVIFRFGRISKENGTGISFKVYAKCANGKWALVQKHFSENVKNDFKTCYLEALETRILKVPTRRLSFPNEPGSDSAIALAPTVRFNKDTDYKWGVYVAIFREAPQIYSYKAYFSGYESPQKVWTTFSQKRELNNAFAGISVRLEGFYNGHTYLRYTIKAFESSLKYVRYDGRCVIKLRVDKTKPWESASDAAESMLDVFIKWMQLKNPEKL